jgi:uncharacterized protein
MSVELRPLGVRCNIGCRYCYQEPQRDAGNLPRGYDVAAMKAALLAGGQPFILFGGEPLLLPKADLEDIWRFGRDRFGDNGVQTNGTLIDDDHVRMFRDYRVRVGISIDGPDELNDLRWSGTLERTRADTARTMAAIARLCAEAMPPSLIVTLHRGNASAQRLPRLIEWCRELYRTGVRQLRLHLLEVERPELGAAHALSPRDNVDAMLAFAPLERELPGLAFDLFRDIEHLLMARDAEVSCVWRACDPYTTAAVHGIDGDGRRTNCGRTYKDGVDFAKADRPGHERSIALYHTPEDHGGCRGCRFFLACKGQCPGTAIDGDWRNRSEHCESWKAVFRHVEASLLDRGALPISVQPNRVHLEAAMLRAWADGDNPTLADTLARMVAEHRAAGHA